MPLNLKSHQNTTVIAVSENLALTASLHHSHPLIFLCRGPLFFGLLKWSTSTQSPGLSSNIIVGRTSNTASPLSSKCPVYSGHSFVSIYEHWIVIICLSLSPDGTQYHTNSRCTVNVCEVKDGSKYLWF